MNNKLLNSVRIGFEFEFIANGDTAPSFEAIQNQLKFYFDDNFIIDEGADSSKHFIIKKDRSVKISYSVEKETPVEISTSPMNLKESLIWSEKFFEFLKNNDYYTNETCGLHVNVSLHNTDITNINPYTLLSMLDEVSQLHKWNRDSNKYCKSLLQYEKIHLADNYIKLIDSINVQEEKDIKYHAINFLKLESNYLEFRYMGGENYHLKNDLFKESVYRIANSIIYSIIGNKKIYKNKLIRDKFTHHPLKRLGMIWNTEHKYIIINTIDSVLTRKQSMLHDVDDLLTLLDKTDKKYEILVSLLCKELQIPRDILALV